MKKIMFNDRYGLTQAVIEGRKTMTRRIIPREFFTLQWDVSGEKDLVFENADGDMIDIRRSRYTKYKVGEVVAVAQSYEKIYHQEGLETMDMLVAGLRSSPGWRNKLFVKAELMPHRIRITGVRCERLQSISNADCLKEGIRHSFSESVGLEKYGYIDDRGTGLWFDTPRIAFASLIDNVSGRGTWDLNPWVVVYEFELVK